MGELKHLQTLEGHTDRVWGLAWNPTNTNILASCSGDKTVRIWQQDISGSFHCQVIFLYFIWFFCFVIMLVDKV